MRATPSLLRGRMERSEELGCGSCHPCASRGNLLDSRAGAGICCCSTRRPCRGLETQGREASLPTDHGPDPGSGSNPAVTRHPGGLRQPFGTADQYDLTLLVAARLPRSPPFGTIACHEGGLWQPRRHQKGRPYPTIRRSSASTEALADPFPFLGIPLVEPGISVISQVGTWAPARGDAVASAG